MESFMHLAGSPAWGRTAHSYVLLAMALVVLVPAVATADVHILNAGKAARFDNPGTPARTRAVIAVGRDRGLQAQLDPTSPATSMVEVEAYLQSPYRTATLARVALDCAKWTTSPKGFRYRDPSGTIRSIRYTSRGLHIIAGGSGLVPIGGPVGYVQGQLTIGNDTLRARFHNFKRNDARVVMTRKPSRLAAAGEAGFWDVLGGGDSSEENEQRVIGMLRAAIGADPSDGRSHFLLAMIHMYRFGQRVTTLEAVSGEAHAEIVAANAAFAEAVPLLWDDAAESGDSRVPGFAAAAKFTQGFIDDDATLRAAGLAELQRAVEINGFFNIFDYVPVLQALPPTDPAFQTAFAFVTAYLDDPTTLLCVATEPEICANAGFAPHNIQGALTLFGDLFAKAGNLQRAQTWYNLVQAFPQTATWTFKSAIDDRAANTAARIALYADADPSNDPPLLGAGAEACATCHLL
jgi:hypothetical protein